jgi:3-deoxy-D-manno-octulosonic-acid transferase
MKTRRSLALFLYMHLSEMLTPLWVQWTQRRLRQGKETRSSLDQRWMRAPAQRPTGKLVWGHAVGVGEALALAGLLRRLHAQQPDVHFLITTTARTSGQALAQQHLGAAFTHAFAPVDTPSNVARFLDHWQPDLALWCEMDLWPALIEATARRGIPHVLVNARLNERSAARRQWARSLYAPLLAGFDAIWAQNTSTAQHLLNLGARTQQIQVTGTIKAMVPALHVDAAHENLWREALGERPVWLLASSHAGEEELALAAHTLLRQHHPDALLVLAPRDPSRGSLVQALCGLDTPLRSQGALLPTATPCYVADTMGELGLWYRLSRVAMVGGSWVPVGGHNPYEGTALGTTVIHGPHVANFSESYTELDALCRSVQAHDAQEIAQTVLRLWASQPSREAAVNNSPDLLPTPLGQLLALLDAAPQ